MSHSTLKKKLHRAWVTYLQPCTNLQEKDRRLNVFLDKIHELSENFGEDFKFSSGIFDPASVVSILARRFIVDVFNICTNDDGEADAAHLVKYLLRERGWKILRVIYIIGPYKVSCRKELTELLLTICAILVGTEKEESKLSQLSATCEPARFEQLFSVCSEIKLIEEARSHSDDTDTTSDEEITAKLSRDSHPSCSNVEFLDLVCRILGHMTVMEVCCEDHPNPVLSELILLSVIEVLDSIVFLQMSQVNCAKMQFAPSLLRLLFKSMASVLSIGNVSKCGDAISAIVDMAFRICERIRNVQSDEKLLPNPEPGCPLAAMTNFSVGVVSGCVETLSAQLERYENVPRKESTTFDILVGILFKSSFANLTQSTCDQVEYHFPSTSVSSSLRATIIQLGDIICVLKEKRMELWLQNFCAYPKIRQMNSQSNICKDHHQLIPRSSKMEINNGLCTVKAICYFLVDTLWGNLTESTQTLVLATVMKAGLCCCMLDTDICQLLLKKTMGMSRKSAFFTFTVVGNLLQIAWNPTGDSAETWCPTCGNLREKLRSQCEVLLQVIKNTDETFKDVEEIVESRETSLKFFSEYLHLLQGTSDRSYVFGIRKHLHRLVTVSLCDAMKIELFIQLLVPVILFKPSPISREDVVIFLLELLAPLLKVKENAKIFRLIRGVRLVCEHLASVGKRSSVLKVLQVLVAQEMESVAQKKNSSELVLTLAKSEESSALVVFHNVLVEHSSGFSGKLVKMCDGQCDSNEEVCFHNEDTVYLLDLWKTCTQLTTNCNLYKLYLYDTKFAKVPRKLLENLLRFLDCVHEGTCSGHIGSEQKFSRVWELVGLLLSMCLRLTPSENQKGEEIRNPVEISRPYLNSLVLKNEHSCSALEMLLKAAVVPDAIETSTCNNQDAYLSDDATDEDSLFSSASGEERKIGLSTAFTYNGYEADTETFDDEDRNECGGDEKCESEQTNDVFRTQKIVYPDVVQLLLELLPKFYKMSDATNEQRQIVVAKISHKMNKICQNSVHNSLVFSNVGYITYVLNEWHWIFDTSGDEHIPDIQSSLLTMLSDVSHHNFAKDELWKLLLLFRNPCAPFKVLVETLRDIVDQTVMQPSTMLKFPCLGELNQQKDVNGSSAVVGFPFGGHCGTRSVWQDGISISSWVFFENTSGNSTGRESAHLISVRADGISLETGIEYNNDQLDISVVSCNGQRKIHNETTLPCKLRGRYWRHFCMSAIGSVINGNLVLQVALFLDAMEIEQRIVVEIPMDRLKISSESLVLVGHGDEKFENVARWNLGNMHVIRGPVLSADEVCVLFSLGPERGYLVEHGPCVKYFSVHSSLITKFLGITVDPVKIHECGLNILQELQRRLLLFYYPRPDDGFMMYKGNSGSSIEPISTKCLKFGSFRAVQNSNLISAIANIGIESVLFLLGHVVEMCSDDAVHTKLLSTVVRILSTSIQLCKQFERIEVWELVFRILSVQRCKTTVYVLKALLDGCLSIKVLIRDTITGNWNLSPQNSAAITNVDLILVMIRSWKIWEKGGEDLLALLFEVLSSLVHKSHPKHAFNLRQLDAINTLDLLLTLCKEKIVHEGGSFYSERLCQSMVSLMRVIIRWPTDMSKLSQLFQCLLLLHPSKYTYVCHASSSFYFRLRTHYRMLSRQVGASAQLNTKHGFAWEHDDLEYDVIASGQVILNNESQLSDDKKQEILVNLKSSQQFKSDLTQSDSISPEPLPASDSSIVNSYSFPDNQKLGILKDNEECPDIINHAKTSSVQDATDDVGHRNCLMESSLLDLACEAVLGVTLVNNMSSLHSACNPAALIVFMHRPEILARKSALQVIDAWLSQANDEQIATWLNMKGFHLVANQLYQYEATSDIVEICFSILLGQPFTFDQRDSLISPSVNLPIFRLLSCPLILSCLCRCCKDVALCRNILDTLMQICQSLHALLVQLVANGAVEVLCKVLTSVSHLDLAGNDMFSYSEWELLLRDIDNMFCYITITFVSLHGMHELQVVVDTLLLLTYCTRMESKYGGIEGKSVLALRNCHCSCLCSIIGHLQENISTYEKGTWISFLAQAYQIPGSQLASTSDLQDRLKIFLVKSVDFLVFAEIVQDEVFVSEEEISFSRYLLCLLMQGVVAIIQKKKTGLRMSPALRDCFKQQFGRLLVFLISPTQPLEQRLFVVNLLLAEEERKFSEVTSAAFGKCRDLEQKFAIFLHHLASGNSEGILKDQRAFCTKLRDILEGNNVITSPLPCPSTTQVGDWTLIFEEKESWLEETYRNRRVWQMITEPAEHRVLQGMKSLCGEISESAADITRTVCEQQSNELKRFLVHIKSQFICDLHTRQLWQKIIAQLTHERALWHHPSRYPQSWQLDSTEGPMRVRKRMTRCKISLAPRFLLGNSRCRADMSSDANSLDMLFESDSQLMDSATIIDQLQDKEKIRCMLTCVIVTPAVEISGEVLVATNRMFFVGEKMQSSRSELLVCHSWSYEDIKELMKRRFQLCDNAIEMFLTDGQTYLIAFRNKQDRDELYNQIMASNLRCLVESDNLESLTKLWRDQLITNFEYLTQINKIAGRSFNDLMQYPVMPFVLANYTEPFLDLNDSKSFRTFCKPMAVQNKSKEQHFINQYKYLHQEQSRCTDDNDALMASIGPYHYGSHYSNSGIVLHFLVRLPPYTQMFLSYQDHNFDIPDRTFHSLHTSWRLSSSESTTDVKELIPEFFFLPEFLLNNEGFNFGVRQTGERVHDVVLPPWCRNNPRLFILIHRQALESSFVTENIHSWIDLVFGFKQTGKAAVEAVNVFHPATYYGFKVEEIQDNLRKNAMLTMIRTFGQTPCQLFKAAHPIVRLNLTSSQQDDKKVKVLEEVDGLQWGSYAGSPSLADPVVIWKRRQQTAVSAFVPLLTNDVFGLTENTCLLLQYCKEKGASTINTTYVMSAALVTWGHPDGTIRLKLKRDNIPQPFIQTELWDDVTVCATVPDCNFLFVGFASGIISVCPIIFGQNKASVQCDGQAIKLYGHCRAITTIRLCRNYSVAVTGSVDRTCIIWDLIKLEYVRSIEGYPAAVELAAISDISGDIATVSSTDKASFVFLHTINAEFVGRVESEIFVKSVCFSNAPEGISINVVCAGLADGTIKMWNTWNLGLVRIISVEKFTSPITCLTYSHDSQHLYAANKYGVLIWGSLSMSGSTNKTPKFLTLT